MFKKNEVDTWMNCPQCNIKLKQKHLSTHMQRVHNTKIDDEKIEPLESSNNKNQQNKIPWASSKMITGLIIIIIVILAFSIFVYFANNNNDSNNQNDNTNSYFVSIDGKGNYLSIQEAVDSAFENDIIFVSSGTYFENIEINKSIELVGEDRNTTIIEGNGSGIVVNILADNVKITGFTIKNGGPFSADSSNAGIVIRSNYNTISDCNVSSNKNYGLYIYSNPETTNNIIKNNIFSYNKYGIYTSYSKSTNISSNTFTHNDEYGLYLGSRSDGNLISDNLFMFTETKYAVRIKTSEENTIIKNQIMNNQFGGLYFCCGAKNNIVYRNIFINNTAWNAKDNKLNNTWDNGLVGNYWDDYTGADENDDGIGDIPYTIDPKSGGNYVDNFPLMQPI